MSIEELLQNEWITGESIELRALRLESKRNRVNSFELYSQVEPHSLNVVNAVTSKLSYDSK